ncbi:hypothetical protein QJS04_geneDACA011496 [Acorus gramineus]|uniref:Uncharacterized protein n=1 Tax=Acorus gramineus TaxID=55184 RepID=A0AAV9A2V7_ACOGR|nr:hypothetical protein QJS04_geneDACA011496 [Acorus gramineus]
MMPRSDGRRDAQAGVPSTRWVSGATCVQRLDGSRDSAIHTKYRISLRSSSMREPRYPLPRVITVSIVMIRCAPRGFGPALPAPGVAVAGKPAGWVRGRCHAPRPLSFLSGEFLGADRAGVVVRFPRPARGAGLHRANRGAGATRTRGSAPGLPPGDVDDGFSWGGSSAGPDNDPSAGSPTETLLRLLLPLNDKVQWTSHNVAGGEPPSSPRSEHFTGPFNR